MRNIVRHYMSVITIYYCHFTVLRHIHRQWASVHLHKAHQPHTHMHAICIGTYLLWKKIWQANWLHICTQLWIFPAPVLLICHQSTDNFVWLSCTAHTHIHTRAYTATWRQTLSLSHTHIHIQSRKLYRSMCSHRHLALGIEWRHNECAEIRKWSGRATQTPQTKQIKSINYLFEKLWVD